MGVSPLTMKKAIATADIRSQNLVGQKLLNCNSLQNIRLPLNS